MEPLRGVWWEKKSLQSRQYVCGHCGSKVGSDKGYECVMVTLSPTGRDERRVTAQILICPGCNYPTLIARGKGIQVPAPLPGREIQHLPPDIDALYTECRKSAAQGAYTAAVMLCRKLLMHIAVDQGAPKNQGFREYVDFLADQGFVPPNGKQWVNHIRELGNEANHEIRVMTLEEAHRLITFVEMLLIFLYELPNAVPQPSSP